HSGSRPIWARRAGHRWSAAGVPAWPAWARREASRGGARPHAATPGPVPAPDAAPGPYSGVAPGTFPAPARAWHLTTTQRCDPGGTEEAGMVNPMFVNDPRLVQMI